MANRRKSAKYDTPVPRRGITDFSSSYQGPSGRRRLSYGEKERRKRILKWVFGIAGICTLIAFGFVMTDAMLRISSEPDQTESPSVTAPESTTAPPTTTKPAVVDDKPILALEADRDILAGGRKLDRFVEKAKAAGVNTVFIEFKDADGYLAYKTALTQVPDASKFASDAVAESLAVLRREGFSVIAGVHCFRDPLAAYAMRTAAVNYDGREGMLWLDNKRENGGKPWLNPFSAQARGYLFDLVEEIAALGVEYILLDSVQLPSASLNLATFTGEELPGALTRNEALLSFIRKASESAASAVFICKVHPDSLTQSRLAIYDGTLLTGDFPLYAADIRRVKKTETLVFPEGKRFIPIAAQIPAQETRDYILTD